MKISKQARREAKQLFRVCFQNGLLDEKRVRETVSRVIELKPRGYLEILSHFHRLVKLDVDRRNARIESAVPLAPDLQESIRQKLATLYGAGLSFTFTQNPNLLGGVRIKVGSDVYDGSVQARLNQLQEQFS
jgi:F-type H+-transporting ATPase subunit delta